MRSDLKFVAKGDRMFPIPMRGNEVNPFACVGMSSAGFRSP